MVRQHLRVFCASYLLVCSTFCRAETIQTTGLSTSQLLERVDDAVERKAELHGRREEALSGVKMCLDTANDARLTLLKRIFESYIVYQTDSAGRYLDLLVADAARMGDSAMLVDAAISRARLQGVRGLYGEALDILASLDATVMADDQRLYYFYAYRTIYGWMEDFMSEISPSAYFHERTQSYRDSILTLATGIDRDVVEADRLLNSGHGQEAWRMMSDALPMADSVQRVYMHVIMAQAAWQMGDSDQQVHHLAITALSDLLNGATEYMALPLLAQALYARGDVGRAYRYMICSMEDATFCKARLRTVESSDIFPIIDRAHRELDARRRTIERAVMAIVGLLALALAVLVAVLHRQKQKLTATRRELARANGRLQAANRQLTATDKLKEEHLTRYMSRARTYLDAIENQRVRLERLAKTHDVKTLAAALRSSEEFQTEQARFYREFDEAFLDLYPHFVERFNALIEPEARIEPPRGELLTTELRIFALVRLGITESASIARFLNYSLTTIYNYRSRIRGRALGDKAEFEARVMAI